jgi:hypothetical protein
LWTDCGNWGWIEGRNIAIERPWSEGSAERVAEIATEFVPQNVDVIVSYGAAVVTFKQATGSGSMARQIGPHARFMPRSDRRCR